MQTIGIFIAHSAYRVGQTTLESLCFINLIGTQAYGSDCSDDLCLFLSWHGAKVSLQQAIGLMDERQLKQLGKLGVQHVGQWCISFINDVCAYALVNIEVGLQKLTHDSLGVVGTPIHEGEKGVPQGVYQGGMRLSEIEVLCCMFLDSRTDKPRMIIFASLREQLTYALR
jgi:hypothetical protein